VWLLLTKGWRERSTGKGTLLLSIGAALISWQIAGIVETNYVDTEVFLIACIIVGWGAYAVQPIINDTKIQIT
jgi:hypothetical protein